MPGRSNKLHATITREDILTSREAVTIQQAADYLGVSHSRRWGRRVNRQHAATASASVADRVLVVQVSRPTWSAARAPPHNEIDKPHARRAQAAGPSPARNGRPDPARAIK